MKINNELKILFQKAQQFTQTNKGDNSLEITSQELCELKNYALKDGKITQNELRFLNSLENKVNVAKISLSNIECPNFDLNLSENDINTELSVDDIKQRLECIKNKGLDINNLDKKIDTLLTSNISNESFNKIINLNSDQNNIFFKLAGKNFQNTDLLLDTFKYLDSVSIDYKDIDELIKNQHSEGRSKKDIISAIQGFAIIKESLSINSPQIPFREGLEKTSELLKSGKLRINEDPTVNDEISGELKEKGVTNPGKVSAGMYYPSEKTLFQGEININDFESRGLLLHEIVHASQDIMIDGEQIVSEAETEAYLAQGIYMNKYRDKSDDDKLLNPPTFVEKYTFAAMRYSRAYEKLENLKQNGASEKEILQAKSELSNRKQDLIDVMNHHQSPYCCNIESKTYKR